MISLFLDILLCFTIIGIAFLSLRTLNLFKAVVLFMGFGILVTLAWVRLNAWDIAIAEAAIGAGITGVLLLVSLNNKTSSQNKSKSKS